MKQGDLLRIRSGIASDIAGKIGILVNEVSFRHGFSKPIVLLDIMIEGKIERGVPAGWAVMINAAG